MRIEGIRKKVKQKRKETDESNKGKNNRNDECYAAKIALTQPYLEIKTLKYEASHT